LKTELSQDLLALFLPQGIFEHFDIVSYETGSSDNLVYDKTLELTLEEKNIIPSEYKHLPYKSCGFMEARYIEDFPIREMLVKLRVRRRRWEITVDDKKKKVSRNWELVAQGTRMSAEYAAFLKEISRYECYKLPKS